MLTKKLIIAGAVILIILVSLTFLFQSSQKKKEQQSQNAPLPTGIYETGGSRGKSQSFPQPTLTRQQKRATVNEIAKKNGFFTLDQSEMLELFHKKLPYTSSDFDIAYSPVLNKYIISKKTTQADDRLNEFLKESGLLSIREDFPDLFDVTNEPINEAVRKREEEFLGKSLEEQEKLRPDHEFHEYDSDLEFLTDKKPQAQDQTQKSQEETAESEKQKKDLKLLLDLMKTLLSFDLTQIETSETGEQISSGEIPYSPTQTGSYKLTGPVIACPDVPGMRRQTVGPGTYPVDNALLDRLFSNSNASGLKNIESQFRTGQVHPKLVTLLYNFIQTNSINVHWGLTTTNKCCKTGTADRGSSCSPRNHFYGRAIDLAVVNGDAVERTTSNVRKAVVWLVNVKGELKPEEVLFPTAFEDLDPDVDGDGIDANSMHFNHIHIGYNE